jgi:hypothetical protein
LALAGIEPAVLDDGELPSDLQTLARIIVGDPLHERLVVDLEAALCALEQHGPDLEFGEAQRPWRSTSLSLLLSDELAIHHAPSRLAVTGIVLPTKPSDALQRPSWEVVGRDDDRVLKPERHAVGPTHLDLDALAHQARDQGLPGRSAELQPQRTADVLRMLADRGADGSNGSHGLALVAK